MAVENPKVFISYCWTSEPYRRRVEAFAGQLIANGIDVLLDVWEMKIGHDMNTFMERCVNDPSVTNVLIVIDPEYARRADRRASGVGIETSIISPEVYGQVRQEKFKPVIFERENGKAVVPTYLKGRLYSDLSDENTYDENFKALVSELYGVSAHKKPPLGRKPDWLRDEDEPAEDGDKADEAGEKENPVPSNPETKRDAFAFADEIEHRKANILVIGVGGTGETVLQSLASECPESAELAYVDTDGELIKASKIPYKMLIDGYGGDVLEDRVPWWEVDALLENRDIVVIAAGMGGYAGSRLAPLIAQRAKAQKILTVGAMAMPSGPLKTNSEKQGITSVNRFIRSVDSYLYVSDNDMKNTYDFRFSDRRRFSISADVLCGKVTDFVSVLSSMLNEPAVINLDLADVYGILSDGGFSCVSTGAASGPDRAAKAAAEAVKGLKINDSGFLFTGVILSVEGSEDMSLMEVEEAAEIVSKNAEKDAIIILATSFRAELEDTVKVTIIASGPVIELK